MGAERGGCQAQMDHALRVYRAPGLIYLKPAPLRCESEAARYVALDLAQIPQGSIE